MTVDNLISTLDELRQENPALGSADVYIYCPAERDMCPVAGVTETTGFGIELGTATDMDMLS